jgi:hypothetical protein
MAAEVELDVIIEAAKKAAVLRKNFHPAVLRNKSVHREFMTADTPEM